MEHISHPALHEDVEHAEQTQDVQLQLHDSKQDARGGRGRVVWSGQRDRQTKKKSRITKQQTNMTFASHVEYTAPHALAPVKHFKSVCQ